MRELPGRSIEKGTSIDICRRKTPVDGKIYPTKVLLENEKKKKKKEKKQKRKERKKERRREGRKKKEEKKNLSERTLTIVKLARLARFELIAAAKRYVLLSLSSAPSMWPFTGIKKS